LQYRILFRLSDTLLTRPYIFEETHTHFAVIAFFFRSILSTLSHYIELNSV